MSDGESPNADRADVARTSDTASSDTTLHMVAWAAILILYLALRIPLLDVPLDRDEGLFGWIGQSILRGDLPYRDVFEHKPPGVFAIYAAALLVVSPTAAGVHFALLLWNLATLLVTASVARALAGRSAGSLAALLAAFAYAVVSTSHGAQGFTASVEMLLLLPMMLSVRCGLAAVASTTARARLGALLAAGACAAATCWIKQSAFVPLLVVPALLLARGADGGSRQRVVDLAWLLVGGVAMSVVVVAFGAYAGGFDEFWYWSFTHSAIYAEWSWDTAGANFATRLLKALGRVAADFCVPVLFAVLGACALRGRKGSGLAILFLVLSLAGSVHSAFLYAHYFAQMFPALAVSGAIGMAWLIQRVGWRLLWAPIALLVLAVPAGGNPAYWFAPDPIAVSHKIVGQQAFEAAPTVALAVREATGADDSLLIYGSEPQVLFLAERRSSNPYGMAYPLTGPYPRQREFQERVWKRVEADPPVFVLLPTLPSSLLRREDTDPFLEEHLQELLARRYRPAAMVVPREPPRFEVIPLPESGEVAPDAAMLIFLRVDQ